jgi:hypothetical protein
MRIGRAIIIPTILFFGLSGASLAVTASATTAAVHASNVHVEAQGPVAAPNVYMHG